MVKAILKDLRLLVVLLFAAQASFGIEISNASYAVLLNPAIAPLIFRVHQNEIALDLRRCLELNETQLFLAIFSCVNMLKLANSPFLFEYPFSDELTLFDIALDRVNVMAFDALMQSKARLGH